MSLPRKFKYARYSNALTPRSIQTDVQQDDQDILHHNQEGMQQGDLADRVPHAHIDIHEDDQENMQQNAYQADTHKDVLHNDHENIQQNDQNITQHDDQTDVQKLVHAFIGQNKLKDLTLKNTVSSETVALILDIRGLFGGNVGDICFCPTCGNINDGSPMVFCDECYCWFHWSCHQILTPPEKKHWYCPKCAAKLQSTCKGRKKKPRP